MSLDHGEVTVELGLRGAMEALGQLNVETIAVIISAGANATPRELEDIQLAVFNHGIAGATEQVVPFITKLMNPNGDDESEDSTKKK
jgi:hypothetical protein